MIWKARALALCAALALPEVAGAVSCEDMRYEGNAYSVCRVDAAEEDLRLFYRESGEGALLGQFFAVDDALKAEGKTLAFAMNAGMYHEDRSPVGHYLENGAEYQRVITSAGPGNFGLLPNGVFCIGDARADVFETLRFLREAPQCRFASQSGPMLVIDGALHPRFLKDSDSRYTRNGVGTRADGREAYFVISKGRVTFHEFGSFMRDALKLPQALYFDGNISRLYAPELGRDDAGFALGPIVGVAVPAQ